jgi:hypothetical protein
VVRNLSRLSRVKGMVVRTRTEEFSDRLCHEYPTGLQVGVSDGRDSEIGTYILAKVDDAN